MLRQAIDRIDHIAILVYPENIQKYVDKISRVFGITFSEPSRNDNVGVIAAVSWDSGLEILAPTDKTSANWKRLEKAGEGTMIIVFGVADIDAAIRRAEENGVGIAYQVKLTGEEPWRDRFTVFREAKLENIFETTFVLSQIEPKY